MHKVHRRIDHVVLFLQWYDQAQFAGFYVANEKNFFDDADIDVEIVAKPKTGNTAWDVPMMVSKAGESQLKKKAFGIWTGDQVLKEFAQQNLRISAVGAVFNRSLACFMVLEDSDIFGPRDFSDKHIGIYPDYDDENIFNWLVSKYPPRLPPQRIVIQPKDDPLELLSKHSIDVLPSYVINEPLEAEARGMNTRLIEPDYYNLQYYSDTIIVNRDTLVAHRDLVARFLQASEKGWRYALDHQDEAVNITLGRMGSFTKADVDQQSRMLNRISLYVNATSPMFQMAPATWSSMATVLAKNNPKMQTVKDCGTLCDFDVAWAGHESSQHSR
jgi:ABC-type nitrate/sulfonate/bicarbonate transport system substrate-binding protein